MASSMLRFLASLLAFAAVATAQTYIDPTIKDDTFTATPVALNVAGGAPKTEIVWSPCSDHMFVIDKSGRLNVLSKTAGQAGFFWDNTKDTYQYADHGPLGMVLHPQFPTQPYLFIYYTKDGINPATGNIWADTCPRVIDTRQFCGTTQKLVRLTLDVTVTNGVCGQIGYNPTANPPFVLKEDWCSNSITHANGDLKVYRGDLLLTSGDGSQAGGRDVGIPGSDTCYDDAMKMPQGKLRSQRLDYLNGKLLRIPAAALLKTTGELTVGTEMKIVARGLRNPYALTVDRNFNVYIGDVGSKLKEEINMLKAAEMGNEAAYPYNFGWPCLQGSKYVTEIAEQDWLKQTCDPATAADGGCDLCTALYNCDRNPAGVGGCPTSWRPPAFEFRNMILDSSYPDDCKDATSSITGLAFLDGTLPQFGTTGSTLYPYNLIASDYGTGCMFTFGVKADETPDFAGGARLLVTTHKSHTLFRNQKDGYLYSTRTEQFQTMWRHGVKLATDGPTAALAVGIVNTATGVVTGCGAGTCQVAVGTKIRMDASASKAGGSAITSYSFYFGGGTPVVKTTATADKIFTIAGTYSLIVTVTDSTGQTSDATRTLLVGAAMRITMTPATNMWKLGDKISYGVVGAPVGSTVNVDSNIYHCGANKCTGQADCHLHTNGVDGDPALFTGTITPPTHDLPSYITVTATVTNAAGGSVELQADTHCMTYSATIVGSATGANVAGFVVDNGEVAQCATPCVQPFMAKSAPTLIARQVQAKTAKIYKFTNWKKTLPSTGATTAAGATPNSATNDILISEDGMNIIATYTRVFPTASSNAVPVLVGARGFYKSIEAMWVVPAGVTYDYVVVSVISKTTLADFSVAVPTGGDFFTAIQIPETAGQYDVKLAGYDYTANTLTGWGQIRTVTASTSTADLCYTSPAAFNAVVPRLPTTIQAEFFMDGGPGFGYYDTTTGNQLNANLRPGTDVDILVGGSVGAGTEYSVGNTVGGEWLQFLVRSKLTRKYYVDFVVRSDTVAHKDLFLQVDTAVCQFSTATVKVEQTGLTNGKWITLRSTNRLSLTAGQHVLRFCVGGGALVIDKLVFS